LAEGFSSALELFSKVETIASPANSFVVQSRSEQPCMRDHSCN
jgi:hypothetical protein